jgi:hypothetical protein
MNSVIISMLPNIHHISHDVHMSSHLDPSAGHAYLLPILDLYISTAFVCWNQCKNSGYPGIVFPMS